MIRFLFVFIKCKTFMFFAMKIFCFEIKIHILLINLMNYYLYATFNVVCLVHYYRIYFHTVVFVSITKETRSCVHSVVHKTFHMMVMWCSTMWTFSLFPSSFSFKGLIGYIFTIGNQRRLKHIRQHALLDLHKYVFVFYAHLSNEIRVSSELF